MVISHDEDFLNSFSDSVLYLDNFAKKVEQYDGDYHTVKTEIAQRIMRENTENARFHREAQAKKDQANKFANKAIYWINNNKLAFLTDGKIDYVISIAGRRNEEGGQEIARRG